MAIEELNDNLIHRVNIGDSLTRTAARDPGALALSDGERRWTYGQFNQSVNRVANALTHHGITGGQAVALASGNSIEFLVTYYACAKLGVTCVPINLGWRPDEVVHVLHDSGATAIVIETELLQTYAASIERSRVAWTVVIGTPPDDVHTAFDALLTHNDASEPTHIIHDRAALTYLYTSGTTSAPKGVVGNHTAVYLQSMTMCLEGQFRSDDRFCAMLPMFHTAQLNSHCTSAVMVGAAIHVLRGFEPGTLLDLIESEKLTQIFGLPTMFRAMLENPTVEQRDLSSLRRALYAMAPMPQETLVRCLEVFDCGFYLLFGQTEMSPTATIFRPENQLTHPGATGTPVVNVQMAIMDETGRLLDRGQTGEIVYRGPQVMTEYLGDPTATEEAFRFGWFHSGDIGHIGDDGILWFTDRRKDVIKTGGENVASIEVEKAIYAASADIAEVVVVGLPHEHWSEAITAFVVPTPGASIDAEKLQHDLRKHIDAFKIPKSIVVVDVLPKTSTGKIQKNVIREKNMSHYE